MMRDFLFRRFTFTSVLVVLFALVGLVPLAAFGFSVVQVAADHLVQRTIEEQKQDVLTDAHQIQHQLDALYREGNIRGLTI
jgi:hypothetical protein